MGKKNIEMYLSMHLNIYGSDYELQDVQLCYPCGINYESSSWSMVLRITDHKDRVHCQSIDPIHINVMPMPVCYEHL